MGWGISPAAFPRGFAFSILLVMLVHVSCPSLLMFDAMEGGGSRGEASWESRRV